MAEAKKKHLIVIHGRSTKPSQKEKTRLVRAALLHGLERVDAAAADKIRQRKVAFTFVYYGDISNRLILEHDPKQAKHLTGRDQAHDNTPCIPDKAYDALLEEHLRRRNFTKKAYKKFLADHADRTWYDNAASRCNRFKYNRPDAIGTLFKNDCLQFACIFFTVVNRCHDTNQGLGA